MQDSSPHPSRELRREANVLKIIGCDPFCLETRDTWCFPSCPPESCQFVRTAFYLRAFAGFGICESNCKGFASPGIVKLVEVSIREEPPLVAVSAQFEAHQTKHKELWQPKRSLWVRVVRQEYGKSSWLCEKVWFGWIPSQIGRAGWEEILWMAQNNLA